MRSTLTSGVALLILLSLNSANVALSREAIAESDPYIVRKVFYEKYWQSKIKGALKYVQGVVVTVNVELTPELSHQIVTREVIGEPTVKLEYNFAKTSTNLTSSLVSFASKNAPQEDENVEQSYQEYEQSSREENISSAGLVPQSVKVAIGIPESHVEKVWQQRRTRLHPSKELEVGEKAKGLINVQEEIYNAVKLTVSMLLLDDQSAMSNLQVVFFPDVAVE